MNHSHNHPSTSQAGVAKIHVIEDSPETRSLLQAILGKAGHAVRLFSEGRSGLDAAFAHPPDLILCDIGMEGVDGFSVLEALRANPATAGVPFIFLSANEDHASFRRALNQRADDYLVKPVRPEDLVSAIERCLQRRRRMPSGALAQFQRESGPAEPVPTMRFEKFVDSMEPVTASARETCFGAVLYFDIRNFTTYAEYLTADEVAEMLHAFFAKACDPIVQQGGWIVKVMGDAVLAMFDVNKHGSECALRAIRAALLIVMAAAKFREWMAARFNQKSLPHFAVGIGIHVGDAVVCGLAGDQEGSPTLIGDTVNITVRIEELTRRLGWSIVVSSDVLQLVNERVEFGRRSTVALRGRDAPVEVVEVIGLEAPANGTEQYRDFYKGLRKSVLENSALLTQSGDKDSTFVPAIEGYRIIRKLGVGGMSVVYLAEPAGGGPLCVIKLLEIGGNEAQAEAIDRFIQEYALVSQIRHPNVAEIYAQGFTDTHAYIVMEYFPGGDLCTAARQGLSMRKVLVCLRDIAAALDAIHRVDIVHRDLKPANVMLRSDGTAVLADFGIAKHLALNMTYSRVGEVFGTPHYVSPEQAMGQAVDGRSDLYSLGVMFYELVTGSQPYQAEDSAQLLGMHVNGEVPRFTDAMTRYQPLLDGLMAKNPGHRFESARVLLRALPLYISNVSGTERTRVAVQH